MCTISSSALHDNTALPDVYLAVRSRGWVVAVATRLLDTDSQRNQRTAQYRLFLLTARLVLCFLFYLCVCVFVCVCVRVYSFTEECCATAHIITVPWHSKDIIFASVCLCVF